MRNDVSQSRVKHERSMKGISTKGFEEGIPHRLIEGTNCVQRVPNDSQ